MHDTSPPLARPSVAMVLLVVGMAFGVLFASAPNAAAATFYHRGPINPPGETWFNGDMHILTGHVTVRPGATLTIQPGVTILFDAGVALYVEGTLVANGNAGNGIQWRANNSLAIFSPVGIQFNFTSSGSVTWGNFQDRFERPVTGIDSSPVAQNNTVNSAFWGFVSYSTGAAPAAGLIAGNTIVRATTGIYLITSTSQVLRNSINGTTVGVSIIGGGAPTIAENRITNVSSAFALAIWAQPGPSAPVIRDNVIEGVRGSRGGNGVGAGADGGFGGLAIGILLDSVASAVIEGNTLNQITGGRGGDGAANTGGTAGDGGTGGPAVAIAVANTPTVDVNWNTITNLAGGPGGNGGGSVTTAQGGNGGAGSDAIGIEVFNAAVRAQWYGNTINGLTAGEAGYGGRGTSDGNGANGGLASGVFFSNANAADATGNSISNLLGGRGGNSTALGGGSGRAGGGGDAIGILSFDIAGSATYHGHWISSLTGGAGGRAQPSGGGGGNATGILAFGKDDGRFNATSMSFNSVQALTGGAGGPGQQQGGEGGGVSGIVAGLVTPSFALNSLIAVQGGAGGDALDGTGGGRGGDAVAVVAVVVKGGWSGGDYIEGITKGAVGAGPPAQTSYGVGFYVAGNATVTSFLTIENATMLNVGDLELYVDNYTRATTINTPFSGAKLSVQAAGNLTVKNYLQVEVYWPNGVTLVPGATIRVEDNANPIYDFVSSTGSEAWLLVTDRVYINSVTATDNKTTVTVSYLSYSFTNNPRSVDMATSHTETFVMIDRDAPTSAAGALPAYTNTWTFNVSYSATDGNGGGLSNITLWYRLDGAGWTPYATQAATAQGNFTFIATADGVYEFATAADDVAGNAEPRPNANDTWTIVDTVRPGSGMAALPTYETSATFLVSWAPDPGVTDIVSYTIQYNRGGGWVDWLVDTTATSAMFTANPAWGTYQFRSLAKDFAGNVEVPPGTNDTWTIVDTERPESRVAVLSAYQTTLSFLVSWEPVGDSFDIATYRIEVNDNGAGWTVWIASTSGTSSTFTGTDGHLYQFRSVATDRAGNVEIGPVGNDTWTVVDVTPPDSRVAALQPYYTTLSFTVSWAPVAGTTDIASYTLEVSDNGGPWTPVPGSVNTVATNALYVGADGHSYAFRTIAQDRAGNGEIAPAGNDTWTIVDVTRPYAIASAPRGAGVNTTPLITITFSEPMDRTSVELAFSLSPDMNGVFVWSADSRTVTFIPDRPLEPGTRYVVAIDSSARDVAGNAATGLYTFDFTTATPPSTLGLVDMWWVFAAIAAAVGASLYFVMVRRRGAGAAAETAAKPTAGTAVESESTIDDVFLLYRDGVLIKHETRRLKPDIDTDILSGMLTAVQQFVRDSFRTEEGELDELTFGQMHILIGRGKFLILAAMIQGGGTESFTVQIKKTIQDIEDHHWDQLEDWDGDMVLAKVLTPYVKKLIRGEYI